MRFLLVLALLQAACASSPTKDTLVILLPEDILNLDPNKDVEFITDAVLFNVYEPLVGLDADLAPRRLLAESWEHPQPERWRFHLRGGVRFHDGTPLTAARVSEALRTIQKSQEEASNFLSLVADISPVDELTLDLVTREPRNIVPNLATIYITKPNANPSFPPLVGTGPYRIREHIPDGRVLMERWDSYVVSRSEYRQVVFQPVPDARRRVARLLEGSADLIYQPPADIVSTPTPGVRFLKRHGLALTYVGFDVRKIKDNPFQDIRLRRAIHLALDRDQLIERVLMGNGIVAREPVPPAVFGYDPSLPSPKRDPALARDLLAQAGHRNGLNARLDFVLERTVEAQLIREQLATIGVSLELHARGRQELYALGKAGKSPMFLSGWSFSSGEASEFYEFCLHTQTPRFGFNNFGSYSNPTIDAIAETNAALLDPVARRQMLQQGAAIVMDDLPVLPLYVQDDLYGVREGITFQPRADGEVDLREVKRSPH